MVGLLAAAAAGMAAPAELAKVLAYQQGVEALNDQLPELASKRLREALGQNDLSDAARAEVFVRLGEALVREGKSAEALAVLDQGALAATPEAPFWKAQALAGVGQLEAAVAHASRGLPMRPPDDARLEPWRARGEALWQQRLGQLDLSCAQCHDDRAGGRLGGAVIPPGNAAGYPTYRLEWQGLGTLQRRLRNCMTGVRAEPWAAGSDEMRSLEVYLAWRDRGLPVEAPAVRP